MTARHGLLRPLCTGLVLGLALLGACRDSPVTLPPPDSEPATLRVSANLSGTLVTTVVVTVTAADILSPLAFNLEIRDGIAGGTLRVPPGPARTFSASAFAVTGEVTHEGSVTTDVRRGENPPLSFVLRPTSGDVPIVITLARFSVEVRPGAVRLKVGHTVALSAIVRDAEGNVVQGEVVWGSANPALATVSNTGMVTARWVGEVQIVASFAGVVGRARITVSERPRQIAFVSTRGVMNEEIYVMDEDGSNVQRLIDGFATSDYPKWSSDGNRITFQSNRHGNYEIYVANDDGSHVRRLTNHPASDEGPTWSPDGTRIAFESTRDGNFEIYVMDADGSNVRRLTNDPALDRAPSWSPDGSRITFMSTRDGSFQIYVMDADGSNLRRLSDHSANEFSPTWSPDGTRIAFTSRRDGNSEIYVMDADGSNLRRLTYDFADDEYPGWSPDGTRIAFTSRRDGHFDIYVMDADGSNVRRLTNRWGYDARPAWQP